MDSFTQDDRYVSLLKRNAVLTKMNPGSHEHNSIKKMLKEIEIKMPSHEILMNTKAAFPLVENNI